MKETMALPCQLDILIKVVMVFDLVIKIGQPLISGSLPTFEHKEGNNMIGFDTVTLAEVLVMEN